MEIGTEISKKIRAAIKGKLQELGAYVDEELPDYIVVMVADKKTSQQMSDDLALFLGNNTIKFTVWLHGVLEKLSSVAVESMRPPLYSEAVASQLQRVRGRRGLWCPALAL
ncbi:zinc finger CCCH domain-containing protein 14 isoform X2 [Oncorhynchus mykiss]|uniref:zinc finger CCCH domain-containing protein 14 isoform X2 n=1 Tax=Oncorhynchus mykiss TaxID=8022 RepID=UPI0018779CB5|nr:zinc finger CCCH domain-containing protein 14 isoform X2 [Oncorhynchus mykiss]XP_036840487.1 zinc finger CCCH domain-containing protein 14 isoform X2 [Oncorhynchus mykiss]